MLFRILPLCLLALCAVVCADEKPRVLDAADLRVEYEANELTADQKYKDKTIELTGWLIGVKKANDGRYYAAFYADRGTAPGVYCYISKESEKMFAPCERNDTLRMTGKVVGLKPLAEGFKGKVLEIVDAKLVERIKSK